MELHLHLYCTLPNFNLFLILIAVIKHITYCQIGNKIWCSTCLNDFENSHLDFTKSVKAASEWAWLLLPQIEKSWPMRKKSQNVSQNKSIFWIVNRLQLYTKQILKYLKSTIVWLYVNVFPGHWLWKYYWLLSKNYNITITSLQSRIGNPF